MKHWFDPDTNFEYRMEFKNGELLIENKEPSEAKWQPCARISPKAALRAISLVFC